MGVLSICTIMGMIEMKDLSNIWCVEDDMRDVIFDDF